MRPATRPCLRRCCALVLALLCLAIVPARAAAQMGLQSEDAIGRVSQVLQGLNLTTNQRILWQQVEARSRRLIAERQAVRDRGMFEARRALANLDVELRQIAARLDAASDEERRLARQIQEEWLVLEEALDDRQRKELREFMLDQLARGDRPAPERAEPRRPDARDSRAPASGGRPPTGGYPR